MSDDPDSSASLVQPPEAVLHFHATVEFSVRVQRLDDARVKKVLTFYGQRTPENDPDVAEQLARNTRLLEALLSDPVALQYEAFRRVAWKLDPICPVEDIVAYLGKQDKWTDALVLDRLQTTLPAADLEYWRSCCEEDLFYDNTSFYHEGLTTTVGSMQIVQVDADRGSRSASS